MLVNKADMENTSPAYQFMGYDACGNKEYLVNVKENVKSNRVVINLDDGLFDDWEFEDDTIKNNEVQRTPDYTDDNKILTRNDFFRMEWKETQYQIYRLLVNISSSLSDIQDVANKKEKLM